MIFIKKLIKILAGGIFNKNYSSPLLYLIIFLYFGLPLCPQSVFQSLSALILFCSILWHCPNNTACSLLSESFTDLRNLTKSVYFVSHYFFCSIVCASYSAWVISGGSDTLTSVNWFFSIDAAALSPWIRPTKFNNFMLE